MRTDPPGRGPGARFGQWQLERVRRAYTAVSGHRSPTPGFAGLVEDMRWGLAHLEDAVRDEADERVLEAIFLGPRAAALLRRLARRAPARVARWMALASPYTLRWLVGPIHVDGANNSVPCCAFREAGGSDLCEHVCRRPTERFCAARAVPVALRPSSDTLGCRWSWGP